MLNYQRVTLCWNLASIQLGRGRNHEESWGIYGPMFFMVFPSIWGVLPGFWPIATELHWTLHVDWFDIPSSTCEKGFADWTELLISGALHHFVLQQQSAAHNQVRRAIWCMNLRRDDTGLRIHCQPGHPQKKWRQKIGVIYKLGILTINWGF